MFNIHLKILNWQKRLFVCQWKTKENETIQNETKQTSGIHYRVSSTNCSNTVIIAFLTIWCKFDDWFNWNRFIRKRKTHGESINCFFFFLLETVLRNGLEDIVKALTFNFIGQNQSKWNLCLLCCTLNRNSF